MMRILITTLALLGLTAAACSERDPTAARRQMVEEIKEMAASTANETGVADFNPRVLTAMGEVPRHEFVPRDQMAAAYRNRPLPIGHGQTISQPFIVALMTELLQLKSTDKVLEVGTGSGYQAAVLAAAGASVFTVEIFAALATSAADRLRRLGYTSVRVRHADGHFGWPEEAPFDAVIVTAAPTYIPPALIDQLRPGGRLLIPVGSVFGVQNLVLVEKDERGDTRTRVLLPVRFVPLLSELR